MSYDISLVNPDTNDIIILDNLNLLRGGTYSMGGTHEATFNVTYNYACIFQTLFGKDGIHFIEGKTAKDTIDTLEKGMNVLSETQELYTIEVDNGLSFEQQIVKYATAAIQCLIKAGCQMKAVKSVEQEIIEYCKYRHNEDNNHNMTPLDLILHYWTPTPANVKKALKGMIWLGNIAPDGVWQIH